MGREIVACQGTGCSFADLTAHCELIQERATPYKGKRQINLHRQQVYTKGGFQNQIPEIMDCDGQFG